MKTYYNISNMKCKQKLVIINLLWTAVLVYDSVQQLNLVNLIEKINFKVCNCTLEGKNIVSTKPTAKCNMRLLSAYTFNLKLFQEMSLELR